MRATIRNDGSSVTITIPEGHAAHSGIDGPDEVTYTVPAYGGYVRVRNTQRQVCKGLAGFGVTLEADEDTLADVIRVEWRRLMRDPISPFGVDMTSRSMQAELLYADR